MANPSSSARALRYHPGADAAQRYPEWVIRHRRLNGIPEVLCRRSKVILLDEVQTWPEKRCSLAHAVAHLDLGHANTPAGFFEKRQEEEATDLAARRLITIAELTRALTWTRFRTELAEELQVDMATLDARERNLRATERKLLRRNVRYMEETA